MNKLKRKFRRLFLGSKWKHLDTLHHDFGIERIKDGHRILWKGSSLGELSSVVSLKQKYSGSCFIVATGPSLADIDLCRIKNYDTISLNGAIKKFTEAGFAPTHAMAVDRRIFERCPEFIAESIESGANCFFSPVGVSRICEQGMKLPEQGKFYLLESIAKKYDQPLLSEKVFLSRCKNNPMVYLSPEYPEGSGTIGFSGDAEAGFFSFKTVAGWAVQLAVWMGYKNIFILGMDLGGTGMTHFYENENNKKPDFLRDYDPYIRVSFEQTRRAMNELDFNVYNLSEQSTLSEKIIPKLTLSDAIIIAERTKYENSNSIADLFKQD